MLLTFLFESVSPAAPPDTVFVAVGQQGRRVMSRDGFVWEHDQRWNPADIEGEHALYAVAFGLGRFVTVGQSGDRGRIVSSRDGVQWTEHPSIDGGFTTIVFAQGRFIVGHAAGLLFSNDGEHFDEGARHPQLGSFRPRRSVCGDTEAGFRTVLIGDAALPHENSRIPWRAATGDGTRFEHHATHTAPASDIAYGSGHFVVVGPRGLIESSHDGQTWQRHATGVTDDFAAIIWTGRRFVVSSGKTAWSSPDGLTWQAELHAIPGRLVWARVDSDALSFNDSVLLGSRDLVEWKPRPLPPGPAIEAIAQSAP